MPAMTRSLDPLHPSTLLAGWLTGLTAVLLSPLVAAAGQGLGAMLGGCGWIGITVPLHRQVWALVNEPTLNFASTGLASAYWLGSMVLPGLLGLGVVRFLPRPRTVASELLTAHLAWNLTLLTLCWIPLLDLEDGHLVRFLELHDLPRPLLFLPSLGALAGALLAALHLLSFARAARPTGGRLYRLGAVFLQLLPPTLAYLAASVLLQGGIPVRAALAVAVPVLGALGLAWSGFPRPWVFTIEGPSAATALRFGAGILVAGALLWGAGRPVEFGGVTGLLWGSPGPYNNVRTWVRPVSLVPRSTGDVGSAEDGAGDS